MRKLRTCVTCGARRRVFPKFLMGCRLQDVASCAYASRALGALGVKDRRVVLALTGNLLSDDAMVRSEAESALRTLGVLQSRP